MIKILAVILFLTGCAGLQGVVATDYAIASGEADKTVKSIPLTDTEKLTIDHAINRYNEVIERWKSKD
jgi:hypothetical protein